MLRRWQWYLKINTRHTAEVISSILTVHNPHNPHSRNSNEAVTALQQSHTFFTASNGKAQILHLRNIQDDIHMDQKEEFCGRLFMLKYLSFDISMLKFQKSTSVIFSYLFYELCIIKTRELLWKKILVSKRFLFFINQKLPEM